ncbi:MAG TPA: nitroreductase family deazaflavin-dependent oxidoreductase [Candidatus Binataceae bacterium]|nr:nitroreductase family deazaflavin-dependent oxidoreductase [Candidatus Binataceae bacterium]
MSQLDDFNQAVIKEFRANKGKVGGQMEGMPMILVTMTGAKSGRTIVKPLVYSKDGDRVVIVASFAGAPINPPWYHNLMKNPVATVEIGTEKFQVRAKATTGEERERLFNQHAAQMPIFNDYKKKTSRQIPVLVLERT